MVPITMMYIIVTQLISIDLSAVMPCTECVNTPPGYVIQHREWTIPEQIEVSALSGSVFLGGLSSKLAMSGHKKASIVIGTFSAASMVSGQIIHNAFGNFQTPVYGTLKTPK